MDQTKWIKAIGLSVITVALFALTWKFLDLGLSQSHSLVFWFWPSLIAAFAVSLLAFLSVVDANQYLFWIVNSAILICYILILPKEYSVYLGGLLFFMFAYLFEKHIRDDEHSRADFSINRIVRSSINFMVYGLLIVLGFNIYTQLQGNFLKNPDAVYNQMGHYAALGLNYVPNGFGDFNPNQTFDDFVYKQAEAQQPDIAKIPKSSRDQQIEEFKKQIEEKFHLQISGNPLLSQVVAGAVASKIKDSAGSYSQFFPAIFAILIIIALRYTAFLFVWLTSILCWVMFWILLRLKFFRIEKVEVPVDKLTI